MPRRALFLLISLLFIGTAALFVATDSRDAQPQAGSGPSDPGAAVARKLADELTRIRHLDSQVWRDTEPFNPDGTLNVFVEIARGESSKRELRIVQNRLEVDRMIPPVLGGYPLAYGFVPQTIAYDGDPLDALVLGPPGEPTPGELVRGHLVGLMHMASEEGDDSKVVISPLGAAGRPRFELDADTRAHAERFFNRYKLHEADEGKFARVTGWSDAAAARRLVDTLAAFFDRVAASVPPDKAPAHRR